MHWEPMTFSANEQAYIDGRLETAKQIATIYGISPIQAANEIEAVKAAYEKPRETFDYKPGFKWLEFRQGHNAIAMQDACVTQAVIKFILYLQRKQAKAA